LFFRPGTGKNTPLVFDEARFYLPKDKKEDVFRMNEAAPLTKDFSGLPTPYLVMNAPLLVKMKTSREIGKDGKNVIQNIYGDKFRQCPLTDIHHFVETTYRMPDSQLTEGNSPLPLNNLICMAAPDQLANPLRARVGPYSIYQIRQIFRTAYTAFRGAVMKTQEGFEAYKIGLTALGSGSQFAGAALICDKNALAKLHPDTKSQLPYLTKATVAIHTGDWGCGSFGGNKRVMAYLQLAAAYATGVDHLYYHTEPYFKKAEIEKGAKLFGTSEEYKRQKTDTVTVNQFLAVKITQPLPDMPESIISQFNASRGERVEVYINVKAHVHIAMAWLDEIWSMKERRMVTEKVLKYLEAKKEEWGAADK
jgi:hypothetical protein